MYAKAEPSLNPQPVHLKNRQAQQHLEQERNELTRYCYGIGFGSLAAGVLNSLWLGLGISAFAVTLTRLQKVSQAFLWLGRLLDEFEPQEVEIIPRIDVPEQGQLDLFIRFPLPPKAVFAVAFRSQGKATVFYSEEKEGLYVRYKRGGLKRWHPDHIERLALQESWLRRNHEELFGQSSRDKRRPCIKLLVMTGETKLNASQPEHLYVTIGDQRVLLLRKRSSIYVLEEAQLIPFIKAWLAQQPQ